MNWIYYILIFWLVCIVIALCWRLCPKDSEKATIKQLLLIAIGAPFFLLIFVVLKVGTSIDNKIDEKKRKEKEQEELEDLSLTIAKRRAQEKRKQEAIKNMFSEDDTLF